ncbi:MAG TPA: aldehyde dehydrogenase (NADP(+)) [Flavisolibacter sp.]
MIYPDATKEQVDDALQRSQRAFNEYRKQPLSGRAAFMRAIAHQLQQVREDLLATAHRETNLDVPRLNIEFTRTLFQLSSYADACEQGAWMDVRIDVSPEPGDQSQEPGVLSQERRDQSREPGDGGRKKVEQRQAGGSAYDLRKMAVPLGPVVVFGASNFPFAYSTAGGDTACALAAGCSVVIKAHPAHPETSEKVAAAMHRAADEIHISRDVVIHLYGASVETGQALVMHPLTSAVGFTGSAEGGRALFDLAARRPVPIPVFAEMGSVNPVFLLSGRLEEDVAGVASMYAKSITQSAGQFCTNPGLLVAITGKGFDQFKRRLSAAIEKTAPEKMLHPGIATAFHKKRSEALAVPGVSLAACSLTPGGPLESLPTLAEVSSDIFLENPNLHREVFGPYSLIVTCNGQEDMLRVAKTLEGQLTCTLIATETEVRESGPLLEVLRDRCGRFILNGVPTGVQVTWAMHHGGPYPATTDSRFTAVGPDGIRRFARPVCYQNWPQHLLPPELQDSNSLGIQRLYNGRLQE